MSRVARHFVILFVITQRTPNFSTELFANTICKAWIDATIVLNNLFAVTVTMSSPIRALFECFSVQVVDEKLRQYLLMLLTRSMMVGNWRLCESLRNEERLCRLVLIHNKLLIFVYIHLPQDPLLRFREGSWLDEFGAHFRFGLNHKIVQTIHERLPGGPHQV